MTVPTMPKRKQTTLNQGRALSEPPEHSTIGSHDFEKIARESLQVAGHLQLLLWLQGEFQRSVPHQVFIAAWGDLSSGVMKYDLVSAVASVRTDSVTLQDLSPLIGGLFGKWVDNGTTPIGVRFDGGLRLGSDAEEREELKALRMMRSALVHGIRDARGEEDCLYAFLSTDSVVARSTLESLGVLLPFVDAASRRVACLPDLTPEVPQPAAGNGPTDIGLSGRELEIMDLVRKGKTNSDIGTILNISTFTVKNHLQRVFRRLNVSNRAQAVSRMQPHPESQPATPVVDRSHGEFAATATSRRRSEASKSTRLGQLPEFAFVVQAR